MDRIKQKKGKREAFLFFMGLALALILPQGAEH